MYLAKEVCRIEKIKSVGALGAVYEHNLRLRDVINADETKTNYNLELTERPLGKTFVEIFHDKIAESPWYKNGKHDIAKNAIYAVEFMLTFGNEATGKIDIDSWAKNNYQWLCENFGGKQNVISAILHLDERTPHIHAIVIPLDEKGKLNYTKYLGGKKYRLSEVQDNYHEQVGKLHNLERGVKGSKASHTDIDNFYSMINEAVAPVTLPDPERKTGFFQKGETASEYQERIAPIVQHAYSLSVTKEKENLLLKQRISEIEHLQEGVVPADLYDEAVQKCKTLEHELEHSLCREKKNRTLALDVQQKYEELHRSIPKQIADAVAKATDTLQKKYDSLKKKWTEMNNAFSALAEKYDILLEKYNQLSVSYKELKSTASHAADLQWENKLMYTLLSSLNQLYRIDKCRIAHAKGQTSIEEKLIYGKEKSQRENSERQRMTPKSADRNFPYDR